MHVKRQGCMRVRPHHWKSRGPRHQFHSMQCEALRILQRTEGAAWAASAAISGQADPRRDPAGAEVAELRREAVAEPGCSSYFCWALPGGLLDSSKRHLGPAGHHFMMRSTSTRSLSRNIHSLGDRILAKCYVGVRIANTKAFAQNYHLLKGSGCTNAQRLHTLLELHMCVILAYLSNGHSNHMLMLPSILAQMRNGTT